MINQTSCKWSFAVAFGNLGGHCCCCCCCCRSSLCPFCSSSLLMIFSVRWLAWECLVSSSRHCCVQGFVVGHLELLAGNDVIYVVSWVSAVVVVCCLFVVGVLFCLLVFLICCFFVCFLFVCLFEVVLILFLLLLFLSFFIFFFFFFFFLFISLFFFFCFKFQHFFVLVHCFMVVDQCLAAPMRSRSPSSVLPCTASFLRHLCNENALWLMQRRDGWL